MVHTAPSFKMAGIIPAEHTFRNEAIKLVYKCLNENPKLIQPTAIKEVLLNRTSARNSQRLNEDKQNIPLARKNGLVYNIQSTLDIRACSIEETLDIEDNLPLTKIFT